METARRVNQYLGQIFRYAMATHRAEHDPTTALRLAPLVFVRPGELRGARWEEFAFDLVDPPKGKKPQHPEPQWRIPAERMKMGGGLTPAVAS